MIILLCHKISELECAAWFSFELCSLKSCLVCAYSFIVATVAGEPRVPQWRGWGEDRKSQFDFGGVMVLAVSRDGLVLLMEAFGGGINDILPEYVQSFSGGHPWSFCVVSQLWL